MAIPISNGTVAGSKKRKRVAVDESTFRSKMMAKSIPTVTKATMPHPHPKSTAAEPNESNEEEDDSESGDNEDGGLATAEMLELEQKIIAANTAKARIRGLNSLLSHLEVG